MRIIDFKKEASGIRLFHGLRGVQKVGSSLVLNVAEGNLPAPTIASNFLGIEQE